ncbi:hypothetical protein [Pandoravirus japonicus]|uniref:Uncharacterized protein n=1 Tax=Pandoravirus japonicus TaxID=2823154 RepID=A0A811BR64_9VIRU|nr:hypothetical protein [Pandoravirus japonicus]
MFFVFLTRLVLWARSTFAGDLFGSLFSTLSFVPFCVFFLGRRSLCQKQEAKEKARTTKFRKKKTTTSVRCRKAPCEVPSCGRCHEKKKEYKEKTCACASAMEIVFLFSFRSVNVSTGAKRKTKKRR